MKTHHYRVGQNKHHLTPRSRGGSSLDSNLLWMKIDRHKFWHKIFGNMTLEEVIRLLTRLKQMKDAQGHLFRNWGN